MQYAAKQLKEIAAKVEKEIPFDPEWANGTGYFDGLVTTDIEGLKNGDRFKSTDTHGRLIVGVKTPFGNVVVFSRYSGEDSPVVNNTPRELGEVVRSGMMTEREITSALGFFSFDKNIGKVLDMAMKLGAGELVTGKVEA